MKIIFRTCLLISTLVLPFDVVADSPVRPYSHSVVSSNREFIFIMIALVERQEDGDFAGRKARAEAQSIRAKYNASGLYKNDGSTTPLWTVGWYAHSVLVASDGKHLVREGYWTQSLNDEALAFFADGKEIRSYKVGDLFFTSKGFPRRMDQFFWNENTVLDETKQTLTLTTTLKEKYEFNYATGELYKSVTPFSTRLLAVVFLAVTALLCICCYVILYKR